MKKFWKSLMFAAVGVFALSSCEDVPAPYDIPGTGGGETPVVVEPTGEGTLENPYNVAAANELTASLERSTSKDNVFLSDEVYVKGIISSIDNVDTNFGNAVYFISDDGSATKQLEVYRGYYLDGAKFTSSDQIAVGDTVVVCGQLQNWLGTYEFTTGSKIVYHNGAGNVEPVEGIEVTCAEAAELTNALEDGATSAEVYSVTGYITEVVGNVSKNQQTFWMADEKGGGKVFEAYWANLPEGVTEFKTGMKVKITGNLMKYVKDGKVTPEIKNATVEILEDGGNTPTPEGIEVTCAEAVNLTNALEDGATSAEVYSVTGYITEVVGSVSRNQQSFWMADTKDGGKVFEAYYANLPEGVSEFKAGMKVKITGNLMKYVKDGNVTPEIKNATVVILEDGGNTPTPTGTEVTCAQAVDLTNALADGATSDETYTVTGYITEVFGNVSRNQQSFWMADTKDGGKVFEAYWANLPEGVSEFKVGMKVKITGKLTKYVKDGNVTPEIKNADVEILEGGQGGGGETPDTPEGDVTIAASAMGLANGAAWETVTVNGVTFTADGGGNNNSPKYYDNGTNLRMYPKNTLTLTASKNIASIVLTCASGSVANGNVGATPGSVNVSDPTITISGINSKTVKIANNDGTSGAASQIRIVSFAITFAE